MRVLRGVLRVVRLVAHLLRGLLTIRLYFGRWDAARRQQAIQAWARGMLDIAGVQLRVQGEPVQHGAVLRISNHVSWLDIPLLMACCPVNFVSKADVRHWPLLGKMATACGTLYIEREKRRDAMRVVHHMAEGLRDGLALGVFPEGTTSDGAGLLPFHANLFQAAVSADAPLQGMALRFVDRRHGRLSLAPAYVGDDTLLGSIWRTVTAAPLLAVVSFAPVQSVQGRDRRALAQALQADVQRLLDHPVRGSPP